MFAPFIRVKGSATRGTTPHLHGLPHPHQPRDEQPDQGLGLFSIWWLQLRWLGYSQWDGFLWGLWLCCFSLRVRFCDHFPKISGKFFATFKGMGGGSHFRGNCHLTPHLHAVLATRPGQHPCALPVSLAKLLDCLQKQV